MAAYFLEAKETLNGNVALSIVTLICEYEWVKFGTARFHNSRDAIWVQYNRLALIDLVINLILTNLLFIVIFRWTSRSHFKDSAWAFYHLVKEHGFVDRNIKVFFANGDQGIPKGKAM